MLVVLSIVLQSLSATASITSVEHQMDIAHLQTEHSHQNDSKIFLQSALDESHDVKDCHHCGHCSGAHFTWLFVANQPASLQDTFINEVVPYQVSHVNTVLDAIQRPPIA